MSAEDNAKLVEAFFLTWNDDFEGLLAGFRTYLAEDCFLQQTRTPDLSGLKDIIPFMERVRDAGVCETIFVEVRNLVAQGNLVASERIDYLRDKDGKTLAALPCVGVMEIANGKIAVWRDYFDSADMAEGAMAVAGAELTA